MNNINYFEMKRLFFIASAMLLSAGMLLVSACGSKPKDDDAVCSSLGQDKAGASCQLYSTDNVCCDETTCTLTHDGKELQCDKPNPGDCAEVWLSQLCSTASLEERQELAQFLSARTAQLMNEVRLHSVCCY